MRCEMRIRQDTHRYLHDSLASGANHSKDSVFRDYALRHLSVHLVAANRGRDARALLCQPLTVAHRIRAGAKNERVSQEVIAFNLQQLARLHTENDQLQLLEGTQLLDLCLFHVSHDQARSCEDDFTDRLIAGSMSHAGLNNAHDGLRQKIRDGVSLSSALRLQSADEASLAASWVHLCSLRELLTTSLDDEDLEDVKDFLRTPWCGASAEDALRGVNEHANDALVELRAVAAWSETSGTALLGEPETLERIQTRVAADWFLFEFPWESQIPAGIRGLLRLVRQAWTSAYDPEILEPSTHRMFLEGGAEYVWERIFDPDDLEAVRHWAQLVEDAPETLTQFRAATAERLVASFWDIVRSVFRSWRMEDELWEFVPSEGFFEELVVYEAGIVGQPTFSAGRTVPFAPHEHFLHALDVNRVNCHPSESSLRKLQSAVGDLVRIGRILGTTSQEFTVDLYILNQSLTLGSSQSLENLEHRLVHAYLDVIEAADACLSQREIEHVGKLARLYRDHGRYDVAESLYLRVLEARERTLGPEHPKTLMTRFGLATVLQRMGRHAEALAQLATTLAGEIALHGEDHPSLAMTHWNMARCLRNLHRPAEAAEHRRRCWEIECKDDGAAAAGTLQTAHALAQDLIAAEQSERAMAVVSSALTAAVEATDEDEARENWIARLQALRGGES